MLAQALTRYPHRKRLKTKNTIIGFCLTNVNIVSKDIVTYLQQDKIQVLDTTIVTLSWLTQVKSCKTMLLDQDSLASKPIFPRIHNFQASAFKRLLTIKKNSKGKISSYKYEKQCCRTTAVLFLLLAANASRKRIWQRLQEVWDATIQTNKISVLD